MTNSRASGRISKVFHSFNLSRSNMKLKLEFTEVDGADNTEELH